MIVANLRWKSIALKGLVRGSASISYVGHGLTVIILDFIISQTKPIQMAICLVRASLRRPLTSAIQLALSSEIDIRVCASMICISVSRLVNHTACMAVSDNAFPSASVVESSVRVRRLEIQNTAPFVMKVMPDVEWGLKSKSLMKSASAKLVTARISVFLNFTPLLTVPFRNRMIRFRAVALSCNGLDTNRATW